MSIYKRQLSDIFLILKSVRKTRHRPRICRHVRAARRPTGTTRRGGPGSGNGGAHRAFWHGGGVGTAPPGVDRAVSWKPTELATDAATGCGYPRRLASGVKKPMLASSMLDDHDGKHS